MKLSLANLRKFIAALSGAAAEAVSLGLLSGNVEKWVTGVLAVVTAAVVYFVPNGAKAPAPVVAPAQPAKPADAGLSALELLIGVACILVIVVAVLWLAHR